MTTQVVRIDLTPGRLYERPVRRGGEWFTRIYSVVGLATDERVGNELVVMADEYGRMTVWGLDTLVTLWVPVEDAPEPPEPPEAPGGLAAEEETKPLSEFW